MGWWRVFASLFAAFYKRAKLPSSHCSWASGKATGPRHSTSSPSSTRPALPSFAILAAGLHVHSELPLEAGKICASQSSYRQFPTDQGSIAIELPPYSEWLVRAGVCLSLRLDTVLGAQVNEDAGGGAGGAGVCEGERMSSNFARRAALDPAWRVQRRLKEPACRVERTKNGEEIPQPDEA